MTGSGNIISAALTPKKPEGSPTVRFASTNEEIEPQQLDPEPETQRISKEEEQNIKELSKSLQSSALQGRRMSNFAFEPVSLPVSRVCSHFCTVIVGTQKKRMKDDCGTLPS